jgi:hypothetical protein
MKTHCVCVLIGVVEIDDGVFFLYGRLSHGEDIRPRGTSFANALVCELIYIYPRFSRTGKP